MNACQIDPERIGFLQVATAAAMDKHPICFRFPRGNGLGVDLKAAGIEGFKGVPMEVPRQLTCLCGIAAPASELRICDLHLSSCCITAPKNQVFGVSRANTRMRESCQQRCVCMAPLHNMQHSLWVLLRL